MIWVNKTLAQVFSCEFCEISKNTFLQNTSGRLLLTYFYSLLRYLTEPLPWKFQRMLIENLFSRGSNWRCSMKKGVLKNFKKLTGKQLRQSLIFNQVAGRRQNTSGQRLLILRFYCSQRKDILDTFRKISHGDDWIRYFN